MSESTIPFSRLVRVEWRKAYDTRGSMWLLISIAILVFLAELIATLTQGLNDLPMAWGDFSGIAAFVTSFLLPVLGITLVTQEWGQRTGMVTFALEPRRVRVVMAKWVVGVLLTVATVVFAVVLGAVFNVFYAMLADQGADWTFGFADVSGFLVTQTLNMTIGFALACLFLNTPAAIVVFFVYSWVLPTLLVLGTLAWDWFHDIFQWLDFSSAQEPFFNGWDFSGKDIALLLSSAFVWVGIPLILGVRRIMRAEVK